MHFAVTHKIVYRVYSFEYMYESLTSLLYFKVALDMFNRGILSADALMTMSISCAKQVRDLMPSADDSRLITIRILEHETQLAKISCALTKIRKKDSTKGISSPSSGYYPHNAQSDRVHTLYYAIGLSDCSPRHSL